MQPCKFICKHRDASVGHKLVHINVLGLKFVNVYAYGMFIVCCSKITNRQISKRKDIRCIIAVSDTLYFFYGMIFIRCSLGILFIYIAKGSSILGYLLTKLTINIRYMLKTPSLAKEASKCN